MNILYIIDIFVFIVMFYSLVKDSIDIFYNPSYIIFH